MLHQRIKGYKNYFISKKGVVYSVTRGSLKVLKGSRNQYGYRQVGLTKKGKLRMHLVSRLVATAYIPNPDGLETVNHIDEDKSNDRKKNLEWMSRADNTEYSQAKYFKFVSPANEIIEVYNLSKFCRNKGLHRSSMQAVYRGKRLQHCGWTAL